MTVARIRMPNSSRVSVVSSTPKKEMLVTPREMQFIQRLRQLQNVGRPAMLLVEVAEQTFHLRRVGNRDGLQDD